jgi:hypothetical protein
MRLSLFGIAIDDFVGIWYFPAYLGGMIHDFIQKSALMPFATRRFIPLGKLLCTAVSETFFSP